MKATINTTIDYEQIAGAIIAMPVEERKKMVRYIQMSLTGENKKNIEKCDMRSEWERDAIKMHASNDDTLLIPDIFEDEKMDWWTWK
ncbi:MAG: hypothetical protein LBQ31_10435 [Bacteroidales bacterium]|jgi:hypothetical protein|nr:hypothetical protein [Bacteroidales bacterium]